MPRNPAASIKEPSTVVPVLRPRGAPAETFDPSPEEVRVRAYEIYVARGAQPGREAEDWAKAEAELRSRVVAR